MVHKIKELKKYARNARDSVASGQHKAGTYSRGAGDTAKFALAHIEQELEKMYETICESQSSPAVIIKM